MSTVPQRAVRQHVTSTPGVLGGKPCIAGTRIRVQDVYVWHELQGMSVDEIVTKFPQLTHADVYAAMSYFWDHRDEILTTIRAGDDLVVRLRSQHPSKLPSAGNP